MTASVQNIRLLPVGASKVSESSHKHARCSFFPQFISKAFTVIISACMTNVGVQILPCTC